jgi:alcohol dehydrogenase (cytochrome c)
VGAALGGMQDVGQNGPENEVNPLIDNGFMYTSDGWGTIYKIDARNPNKGEYVWISDSGVRTKAIGPRTRGIALWEDLVIANLPDGRVIALNRDTRRDRLGQEGRPANEFGTRNGSSPPRSPPRARSSSPTAPAMAGTRGWSPRSTPRPATSSGAGTRAQAGEPGSETWKDKNNAWKTGGGGLWQTGSYDPRPSSPSGAPAIRSRNTIRGPPGRQSLHQLGVALDVDTGKLVWHFQYTPNDSWDYDEIGIHMLYDTRQRRERKVVATSRATASSTRSIAPMAASSRAPIT